MLKSRLLNLTKVKLKYPSTIHKSEKKNNYFQQIVNANASIYNETDFYVARLH